MSKIEISTGHPDAGRIYAEELRLVTAERDQLQFDKNLVDQQFDDLLHTARILTIQIHAVDGKTEFHEDTIAALAALENKA